MERNSAALNQAMRNYYQSGLAAKQGTETEKYYMNTVSTEVILRQRSDLRRLSKRGKKKTPKPPINKISHSLKREFFYVSVINGSPGPKAMDFKE